MMVFKRKQIIAGALVVMIGLAGYLNYIYDEESQSAGADANKLETANIGQVQMVNGTLEIKSVVGKGTKVFITIPKGEEK